MEMMPIDRAAASLVATAPPEIARRRRMSAEAIWLIPCTIIVLAVVAIAMTAAAARGVGPGVLIRYYAVIWQGAGPTTALTVLCAGLIRAIASGTRTPFRYLWLVAKSRLDTFWGATATIAPLVLWPTLLAAFGLLKLLLPDYTPFRYDAAFMRADRWLFGTDPWRITHAIAGDGTATILMDRLYTAWIMVIPFTTLWFAVFASRRDRARYFTSFILSWVLLGVAGAYLGSSAGPTFLALMEHPDAGRFAGLMQRLQFTDALQGDRGLDAIRWRDLLWHTYANRQIAIGMGISAMPSMHNAISALRVFSAYRINIWLGHAVLLLSAVIYVASIHLAWHYAVDGIVSMLAVAVIWFGVDYYLRVTGFDARIAAETPVTAGRGAPAAAAAARSI